MNNRFKIYMGHLKFRLRYGILQRKNAKQDVPKEIRFEITKRCNLDCYFCFKKQNKTKELSLEKIKKIIDNIYKSKIKAIRFTGGEPFLRKNLKHITKYAKNKGLYVIINTNGALIEKNTEPLKHTDSILLSFHDIKRFEEIKDIIKKLEKNKIVVRLATILTKNNINNLEEFYKKSKNLKFNEWFFLRPIMNIKDKQLVNKKYMQKAVEKIIKNNLKFNMSCFIANSVPFCIFNNEEGMNSVASICIGGINDNGNSRLVIDPIGNIKTDYFSDIILGNALKDKIKNIWKRKKEQRGINSLPIKCKKCKFKNQCKGGITIWNTKGNIITKDPLLKDKV